jgi:carbonic anhydrase
MASPPLWEFAVQVLKVGEIVVMGHGRCGGCQAALTQELKDAPPGEGGFIAHWIDLLDDARDKVKTSSFGDDHSREALRAMEKEGVKVSLTNLRTFPCIREKEKRGRAEADWRLFRYFRWRAQRAG